MMRVPDMILASAVYLCVKDANGSVRPALEFRSSACGGGPGCLHLEDFCHGRG
jgi:hypothetical protein